MALGAIMFILDPRRDSIYHSLSSIIDAGNDSRPRVLSKPSKLAATFRNFSSNLR